MLKVNAILNFKSIVLSYAEIFFLKNHYIGLAILAITFLHPNLGLAGLISIITGYLFALLVGYEKEFLKSGHYTYNSLLVGLSIGQLFTLTPLTTVFIIISAIITFLVTIAMADIFNRYFLLPILSTPFVIVTSLIYLSAAKFSNLMVNELYATGHITFLSNTFPYWINGLLRSLGAIIFMPSPFVGLIILVLILIHSRILFILAILGYYTGIALQGAFIGSYPNAFYDLNAFNYPLIAMALGAIFTIPAKKSYFFALTGVLMATVLIKSIDIFWSKYGIPVFTLPFLLITLGYIYVLGLLKFKYRPTLHKNNPEQTAEYFYAQQFRYTPYITMLLPFLDEWSIYQGFFGEWTHKGIWKYAYDFVKRDNRGLTYQNEGKQLDDYYCYKKPVHAPCSGYVIHTCTTLPDNPIGVVDTLNNWGNYVIIQDYRGYYIGLCHLSTNSILVKPGDWVNQHQQIALCGNSGYSPEPHIHMQYQLTNFLTSTTLPFSFTALTVNQNVQHYAIPQTGDQVAPFFTHQFYFQVTNFVLDEKLHFKLLKDNIHLKDIEITIKMAIDGTFYFSHKDSHLYFGKSDTTFYMYHLEGNDFILKLLYQALPSMPLGYIKEKQWHDIIPSYYLKKELLNLFLTEKTNHNARYCFTSDTVVEGIIHHNKQEIKTIVKLDPYLRFKEITVDNFQLIATEVN